ncbi:MAG TPA: DUF6161 domain-containing protein [Beijerinckiaceae bacterium]|jgi:hypothetical protein
MVDLAKILFDFDLQENGGKISFNNNEEIGAFLETQSGFYAWVHTPVQDTDSSLNNVRMLIMNALERVKTTLNQCVRGEISQEDFYKEFYNVFSKMKLPIAETARAQFISQLRHERGAGVALAALAFFINRVSDLTITHRDVLLGIVAASEFERGLDPGTAASARQALDNLASDFGQKFRKAVLELESAIQTAQEQRNIEAEAFLNARSRNRRFTRRVALAVARRLRDYKTAKETELNAAKEEFKRVEDTYREHMRIKAPVDYWTAKAEGHRDQAASYRLLLIVFAVLVGGCLLIGLYFIGEHAVDLANKDKPPAAFLPIVTVGIVASTMAFWAARVIVRLFMSEHHLAIDADERATMAMTYLALTERGAVDEKDRAIILTALFRPSSDGIVKDDAAPDIGPAALLSKTLDRR